MTSVVIYPPWKGAATLAVNSAKPCFTFFTIPADYRICLRAAFCYSPHRATGPSRPTPFPGRCSLPFPPRLLFAILFSFCGWVGGWGGGGGGCLFFFGLFFRLGGWGVSFFFSGFLFCLLRGWVGGWLGCCAFLFFLAFAVLVVVAGWCGGCPGLPVVVRWLLSRGVVGCVVWLVVGLRCFAAPFFVVVALVVVVPGVRRCRCCCCCCCCCCCRCRCCCCCLPFGCCLLLLVLSVLFCFSFLRRPLSSSQGLFRRPLPSYVLTSARPATAPQL